MSVNILDHTDKLIIKVLNIDKIYDNDAHTLELEFHNSTLKRCTEDQFFNEYGIEYFKQSQEHGGWDFFCP